MNIKKFILIAGIHPKPSNITILEKYRSLYSMENKPNTKSFLKRVGNGFIEGTVWHPERQGDH
jgi:hypothetical protein